MALLLLPPPTGADQSDNTIPLLSLPDDFTPKPDPFTNIKKYTGRMFDRIIGLLWSTLVFIGAGYTVFGVCNFVLGLGAWTWWRSKPGNVSTDV